MKLWVHRYTLEFATGHRASRSGFLIKVQTPELAEGYSDCFSWPELGDPGCDSLMTEIQHIAGKSSEFLNELPKSLENCSSILGRSLQAALADAQAREEKRSLLLGQEDLKNHHLHLDLSEPCDFAEVLKEGFAAVKIKTKGADLKSLKSFLQGYALFQTSLRLRVDCNGVWSKDFAPLLEEVSEGIDFIEDPLSKVDDSWVALGRELGIPLAYDQVEHPLAWEPEMYATQILKPAKSKASSIRRSGPDLRAVFTSYLGHPVGQAHDMSQTLVHGNTLEIHGLKSHAVYKGNAFSREIQSRGPSMVMPGEYGIGFDEQLKGLAWHPMF